MYVHLFTGVLILLALGLLTPYFYFIPKAALAAVIICAVIFMIEYEVVKPMWKSSRKFKFVMVRILGLYNTAAYTHIAEGINYP
jgi:MFS superfamily sulfate permease-like transporter